MLVITRKNGQKIMINDNIEITIVEAKNGVCKVAIKADKDVKIYREEIYLQIKLANLIGKNTNVSAVDSVSNLIKSGTVLNDKAGVEKVEYAFSDLIFEMTDVEYHEKTGQVKSITFEEKESN